MELATLAFDRAEDALDKLRERVGRVTGRVATHEEERARSLGEQLLEDFEQGREVALDVPDLALRSPAEGRGVEDDAVVLHTATRLALGEGERVVGYPSNGVLGQAGELRVFVGPVKRLFRGIYMRPFRTRLRGDNTRNAGVAEQV